MKNELVKEPMIDTIEEIDLVKNQDDLTPEQCAYWLESIERDMRNMDQPKKYVSLEQFGQELMLPSEARLNLIPFTIMNKIQNNSILYIIFNRFYYQDNDSLSGLKYMVKEKK